MEIDEKAFAIMMKEVWQHPFPDRELIGRAIVESYENAKHSNNQSLLAVDLGNGTVITKNGIYTAEPSSQSLPVIMPNDPEILDWLEKEKSSKQSESK